MRNLHQPTAKDAAKAWADVVSDLEQRIERLVESGPIHPEVMEALQDGRNKFKQFRQMAGRGGMQ